MPRKGPNPTILSADGEPVFTSISVVIEVTGEPLTEDDIYNLEEELSEARRQLLRSENDDSLFVSVVVVPRT